MKVLLLFSLLLLEMADASVKSFNVTKQSRIEQVQLSQSFWHQTLYKASNGTGLLSRDPTIEALIRQIFNDIVKKDLAQRKNVLGLAVLDPVWLYPIGPVNFRKKGVLKGTLTACDLRFHNMKTVLLHHVDVRRDLHMNTFAVRLLLKVPITWMTGYYSLKNAKLFHFIPAGGDGNFNVDLKYVSIEVVATMKSTEEMLNTFRKTTSSYSTDSTTVPPSSLSPRNTSTITSSISSSIPKQIFNRNRKQLVCLDVFEIGIHWRKAAFKFDGLWKGFNHLTDFSLNQFGLGNFILKKKKGTITREIKLYIRRLSECLLHHAASEGIDKCMIRWWETRGWTYPWTYPVCQ